MTKPLTKCQKEYIDRLPIFALDYNVQIGLYAEAVDQYARDVLDRTYRASGTGPYDPVNRPSSAHERKLGMDT